MTPREQPQARAYRFGPLERRGVAGGLRLGQVLSLASAGAVAVLVLRLLPGATGLLIAVAITGAAAFLSFAPIAGRTPEEWLPIVLDWIRSLATGAHRFRSRQPAAGVSASLDGAHARREVDLPPPLAGCEILSVPVADGHELGVFKDRRLGAYTAVLSVRARSLGLLPTVEHERRLDRWGRLLASLARGGSAIRRVQVLERTAPCDAAALTEFLEEASDPSVPDGHAARRSYEALLDGASRVTQDHEVLIAVQVDQRRAWSRAARDPQIRQLDRDEQACRVLARELQALASRFDPVDLAVAGLLTPEQYAAALHVAFDPYGGEAQPWTAVAERDTFAPTAADTTWTTWRTDGGLHRTYWIAQWPRLPVGPLFLSPLLLGVQAVRSVSITLEPVAPDRARRAVEAAITSDEADEDLRERRGFRTTARRRRQQEATLRREDELASGHEELRFAGYVSVTGRDEDELARACEEIEQAALQAHLDLRPLWGEQDTGFVHASLPIARGLRAQGPGGAWA